jgi:NADH-quinone oxidoreductase subunit H
MKRLVNMLVLIAAIVVGLFGFFALAYYTVNAFGVWSFRFLGAPPALGQAVANIVFLQLLFVMILATLLTLAERKWSAAMQDRIGPNRARIALPWFRHRSFGGLLHIAADALKMLTKEDLRPASASAFLYHIAPILNFAPIFCLFAIVPVGPPVIFENTTLRLTNSLQIANPDVGLLYLFGIASIAVYGVSLAGWASDNKLALLGGVRASAQMISYEVALGLGLVGMMMVAGTLRMDQMIEAQQQTLFGISWLPAWGIFVQPLGFLLFFAAAFAETKRAPFDLPEGESEIIGYFIEYSGMKFGMYMIGEFIEVVTLAGVVTAIFFGGYHLPPSWELFVRESVVAPLVRLRFSDALVVGPSTNLTMAIFGATVFACKVLLLCWLQLAIRWTFPRFRYDQVQTLGWRILLPLGLVNVFVTGACLLLDKSVDLLAAVGLLEIALFVSMVLWSSTEDRDRAANRAARRAGASASPAAEAGH